MDKEIFPPTELPPTIYNYEEKCRIPFCRYERRYKKNGRGHDVECEHKSTWRHFGHHLICKRCGGDGT